MANSFTNAFYDRLTAYVRDRERDPPPEEIKRMSDEVDRMLRSEITGTLRMSDEVDRTGTRDPGPWMTSAPSPPLSYNGGTFRVDENTPDGIMYEVRNGEYVINAKEYEKLKQLGSDVASLGRAATRMSKAAEPPADPNFPRKLDID